MGTSIRPALRARHVLGDDDAERLREELHDRPSRRRDAQRVQYRRAKRLALARDELPRPPRSRVVVQRRRRGQRDGRDGRVRGRRVRDALEQRGAVPRRVGGGVERRLRGGDARRVRGGRLVEGPRERRHVRHRHDGGALGRRHRRADAAAGGVRVGPRGRFRVRVRLDAKAGRGGGVDRVGR
eukprot:31308-Pelagococcus_subviridis.AAC.4